jgi:phage recombination protein Bet
MSNQTALTLVAKRLSVTEQELQSIVINTVMPNKGQQVTNDQFVSFMAVANEYKLNPLVKEIYAFPTKGGGIQPIVSIDGWLKIINSHHQFDGMEHEDILDGGELIAIKCSIFRKDTSRPITVTEYMNECQGDVKDKYGNPTPWGKYPARMLRHKATIQAGRYAFGISGIIDPDEADRFADAGVIEKDITPQQEQKSIGKQEFTQEMLNASANKWAKALDSGKSADDLVAMIKAKYELSNELEQQVRTLNQEEAA